MRYVGIDLHKQSITVCVVDQDRNRILTRRFLCTDTTKIDAFFAALGDFEAVVEATASYEWLVARIEPIARRVLLAHPGKLRVIAESTRKSDNLDARVLAEMLASDQIPPAYRPRPVSGSTDCTFGIASSCSGRSPASATRSAGSEKRNPPAGKEAGQLCTPLDCR